MHIFHIGDVREKLRLAFDMYDMNRNGKVKSSFQRDPTLGRIWWADLQEFASVPSRASWVPGEMKQLWRSHCSFLLEEKQTLSNSSNKSVIRFSLSCPRSDWTGSACFHNEHLCRWEDAVRGFSWRRSMLQGGLLVVLIDYSLNCRLEVTLSTALLLSVISWWRSTRECVWVCLWAIHWQWP